MIVQIEITTHCNLACDYCCSKNIPDQMMTWDVFVPIVDHYNHHTTFVLQGEGEPLLHPDFWEFASYIRDTTTCNIFTTTNGLPLTHVANRRVIKYIDELSVSIDTTDEEEASRIGRRDVQRVIRNVEELSNMGYGKLVIRSVNYGQDMTGVKELARSIGAKHLIQPLQQKPDYVKVYTLFNCDTRDTTSKKSCSYISRRKHEYYNVNGVKFPCCFIKDIHLYPGFDSIHESFSKGIVPGCCTGCKHLR